MKKFLIAGGTGTLGNEFVRQLSAEDKKQTVVIARDELKLKALAAEFPGVETVVCDIRDKEAVERIISFKKPEFVCNFAAMKHVDICEKQPDEALKTNFTGTKNLVDVAIKYGVEQFIFSSTDKAVEPINAYGMTKWLAENYLFSIPEECITVKVFRWGNIIGSRGSVIPKFVKSIAEESVINLTSIVMSRFWLTIEHAVAFMMKNLYRKDTATFIPEMKAAKVVDVAFAIAELLGKDFAINYIDVGKGEKIEEKIRFDVSSGSCEQYSRLELKELLKPVVEKFV